MRILFPFFRANFSALNKPILVLRSTAWKVSKYGVFSGLYFPVFSPNAGNTDQKKLSIWILFTQWKCPVICKTRKEIKRVRRRARRRARRFVVSDVRSESKGSRFESSCYLSAVIARLISKCLWSEWKW